MDSIGVLQHTVVESAIPPGVIKDNAAFVYRAIDISDCDYVEFHVNIGATDIAVADMVVQEAEAYSDINTLTSPTTVLDVATDPADDDDNSIWVIGVDCRKLRKRYLALLVTAGNGTLGTYLSATAVKIKGGARANTTAGREVGNAEYI